MRLSFSQQETIYRAGASARAAGLDKTTNPFSVADRESHHWWFAGWTDHNYASTGLITMTSSTALPRIGTLWAEQGGIFIGVCPGQNSQPDYALIAPIDPKALFIDVQWHDKYTDIPGANSDWDGAANTLAMAEGGSALARDISMLEIEGHKDLYLPARHELRLIKLVAPDLIVEDWHWSSTQCSSTSAWCQSFSSGSQGNGGKDFKLRARAVRRFRI